MGKRHAMPGSLRAILRRAVAASLVAAILVVGACAPAPPATTTAGGVSAGLRSLQKAKYLKASLFGAVDMDFGGQAVTYPLLLAVPSVPIQWMGTIFESKLQGAGPGGEVTIQVHGNVSDDGAWIETMSYYRGVASKGTASTVVCQVVLRNVPITQFTGDNATAIGAFSKTGADVRKHVEKVWYSQGGGQSVSLSYDSVQWENTVQKPVLKLAFETVASEEVSGSGSSGGM